MDAPREGDEILAGINVTPLVDIVLVLLIIFMVTASFILSPSIKVALPHAATAEATPVSTIALVLTKKGALFLNGKATTEEKLAAFLPQAARDNPDVQAIVSADREVAYGEVVHLLDLIRTAGIHKFAVTVEKQEKK